MAEFSWSKVLGDGDDKNPAPTEEKKAAEPVIEEPLPTPNLQLLQGLEATEEPHYRPAHVDQSVHDIKVAGKYDLDLDVRRPDENESSEGTLPVNEAHLDDILRMAIERK